AGSGCCVVAATVTTKDTKDTKAATRRCLISLVVDTSCSLEQRFPIDIRRYRHAEIFEHRRRDIDDARAGHVDRAARDQRARGLLVIEGAVIARPLLLVRIDDPCRRSAERRLPRHAIAVGEAHLELGGVSDERTAVD